MPYLATISIFLGVAAHIAFAVFALVNLLRGITGKALLIAAVTNLVWVSLYLPPALVVPRLILLNLALVSWILLIWRALGIQDERRRFTRSPLKIVSAVALAAGLLNALSLGLQGAGLLPGLDLVNSVLPLLINVAGLILVEQLARNTVAESSWRIRYLAIGLGMLFGFGLVFFGSAIAFGAPAETLLVLHPAVAAVILPFVAIASLRNRHNQLRFNLSRQFVFQTGVLATSGAFLVGLSVLGYLFQLFAGDVGVTIGVFLAIVGIGFLFALVGSARFRANLRVRLTKTFFDYRYDYREEWIRLTSRLTEAHQDYDLNQQVQRSFQSLLMSDQSALWMEDERHRLRFSSGINADAWPKTLDSTASAALVDFVRAEHWVIDLNAPPEAIARYEVELRDEFPELRFIIPMLLDETCVGLCLLGESNAIEHALSWEDYDVLKLTSRQSTGFLALQKANENLLEHEKFAAVNQMSAFLVHDVKTISAQLSLLVQNAEKHKDNPQFIDDMVATVGNSVTRMQKIIAGLQDPRSLDRGETRIDVSEVVTSWLAAQPLLSARVDFTEQGRCIAAISEEDLITAVNHITQNSLEASGNDSRIAIDTYAHEHWVYIKITDDGPGMPPEFVANELFKPFKSEKGVTGMGIGAYQARTILRQQGGDISVGSEPGNGSAFTLRVPAADAAS